MKEVNTPRPRIPRDLWRAAQIAGAALDLSPRDYIALALRDALRRAGELPAGWEMSPEEVYAVGRETARAREATL